MAAMSQSAARHEEIETLRKQLQDSKKQPHQDDAAVLQMQMLTVSTTVTMVSVGTTVLPKELGYVEEKTDRELNLEFEKSKLECLLDVKTAEAAANEEGRLAAEEKTTKALADLRVQRIGWTNELSVSRGLRNVRDAMSKKLNESLDSEKSGRAAERVKWNDDRKRMEARIAASEARIAAQEETIKAQRQDLATRMTKVESDNQHVLIAQWKEKFNIVTEKWARAEAGHNGALAMLEEFKAVNFAELQFLEFPY